MNTEKYSKPTEMSEPLEIRLINDVNKKLPSWDRKNIRTFSLNGTDEIDNVSKIGFKGEKCKS